MKRAAQLLPEQKSGTLAGKMTEIVAKRQPCFRIMTFVSCALQQSLSARSGRADLDLKQKKAKGKTGKRNPSMRASGFALIAMIEPAHWAGRAIRLSPDFKTGATKTTTKTV